MTKILFLLVDGSLCGGIARHVLSHVRELQRRNRYEIGVCTVFPRGELNDALDAMGVRTYALGYGDFNGFGVFSAFRKVFREFNPDTVHIHVVTFWQWVYLALFARRVPTVFTVHSDYGRGTWQRRLMRRFLPVNVRKYIFVSNAVRAEYDPSEFPGEVILNCVPRAESPDRGALLRELRLPADARVVGTACAVGEVKRPRSFVRVMAQVLAKCADAHAVVLGDGEPALMRDIRAIAEGYGVAERFHFMGYRTNARELIAGFSVFVATSEREGMPTAMLEALDAGVPLAFMRGRGGLRDLAALNEGEQGPFGIVVDENDEPGLAVGICGLLDSPERLGACSQNAIRISRAEFDFASQVEKLVRVYEEVEARKN